jgi:hypothetical protein
MERLVAATMAGAVAGVLDVYAKQLARERRRVARPVAERDALREQAVLAEARQLVDRAALGEPVERDSTVDEATVTAIMEAGRVLAEQRRQIVKLRRRLARARGRLAVAHAEQVVRAELAALAGIGAEVADRRAAGG